ncbi:uncharacterized protein LOC118433413 [Folsomia candida]|uniref:Uncharacterized protein n=1 Tax=Folsomia candida TaxID=158441 RepID=A0A226F2Z6_FOLCA|nr:uncharacterized protein LOC118433413 [Folsomia candida]OXA63817.1 hypothetical protein Fcan01_00274 [Folsomia candida]
MSCQQNIQDLYIFPPKIFRKTRIRALRLIRLTEHNLLSRRFRRVRALSDGFHCVIGNKESLVKVELGHLRICSAKKGAKTKEMIGLPLNSHITPFNRSVCLQILDSDEKTVNTTRTFNFSQGHIATMFYNALCKDRSADSDSDDESDTSTTSSYNPDDYAIRGLVTPSPFSDGEHSDEGGAGHYDQKTKDDAVPLGKNPRRD